MTRSRVLVAAANTAVTTLLGSGAGILLSVLMARSLGPSGKGSVDLVVALSMVATLALGFSLSSGLTYTVARGSVDPGHVPGTGLVVALAIGVLCALLVAAFDIPLRDAHVLPDGGLPIVVLLGVLTAIGFYQSVTRAALSGSQRLILANNTDLLARGAGLVGGLLASLVATPLAFLVVLAGSAALAAGLQSAALRPRGRFSLGEALSVIRYSLPSYAANLIQFLNYRLDLFLVAVFRGPADVGLYAVAGSLVQLIWIVYRSAAAVLFPTLAARSQDARSWAQLAEAARMAFVFALAAAIGLAVIGSWAIPLVFGAEFAGSVLPMLLLLPGAVALTPAGVVAAFFLARGEPRVNALISFGAFAVTAVGDVALIPAYGIVGAAIASSLSYGATLLLTIAALSRTQSLSVRDLLLPTTGDIRRLRSVVVSVVRALTGRDS
jgi:O-antigen/teichoic acid export membrane protein